MTNEDALRRQLEDATPEERERLMNEAGLRELNDDELDAIAGGSMMDTTRPGH
jgi:hypothetical protein